MFLNEFNQMPHKRISKINKLLKEQFGINIKTDFPSKKRLLKLKEHAETVLITMRNSNKKFQLDPEYAKFLGIKDVVDTMVQEGMYAESPKFQEMQSMITASVQELMDSGYTMDEACSECMNRYRMDSRFAYDDEYVLPIVLNAAKQYGESCGTKESIEDTVMTAQTDLNERLLRELARECGVKLSNSESVKMIEQKLEAFAKATGKTRESVVGFLNELDEDSMSSGIQMFGRKIAEMNRYNKAKRNAVQLGETEFQANGKTYNVFDGQEQQLDEDKKCWKGYKKTGTKDGTGKNKGKKVNDCEKIKEGKNMGMFDDIISELLGESVDVEQAEVVMAVRALADDLQSQIERIGRMINEDIPAIADQMRSEMGATQAQSFVDSVTSVLSSHLESTRSAKSSIDQTVGGMTGEGGMEAGLGGDNIGGGLPDADPLDAEFDDMGDDEMDTNMPSAAGPEDEPLGRAAI